MAARYSKEIEAIGSMAYAARLLLKILFCYQHATDKENYPAGETIRSLDQARLMEVAHG